MEVKDETVEKIRLPLSSFVSRLELIVTFQIRVGPKSYSCPSSYL